MEKEESKIEKIIKECFDNAQKAVANYTKKLVLVKTEHFDYQNCELKFKCPTCDMSLPYLEYDYCPYCGQHLDWSEFIG